MFLWSKHCSTVRKCVGYSHNSADRLVSRETGCKWRGRPSCQAFVRWTLVTRKYACSDWLVTCLVAWLRPLPHRECNLFFRLCTRHAWNFLKTLCGSIRTWREASSWCFRFRSSPHLSQMNLSAIHHKTFTRTECQAEDPQFAASENFYQLRIFS